MMEIVKRESTVIDFDLEKISEAMMRVINDILEAVEKEVDRISGFLENLKENFENWIAQLFSGFLHLVHARFDPVFELRLSARTLIIIRICTATFLNAVVTFHRKHRMRPQNKGTDKNSESDHFCTLPVTA